MAVPTGFEPAFSALTGPRVCPGYTTGPAAAKSTNGSCFLLPRPSPQPSPLSGRGRATPLTPALSPFGERESDAPHPSPLPFRGEGERRPSPQPSPLSGRGRATPLTPALSPVGERES